MKSVAKLDTAVLDRITAQLEPRAANIIGRVAKEIEGDAKMRIGRPGPASHPRALVDTGALMSSILAEAKDAKRLSWWVHDGVEYGIHWELGFHQMVWGRFQMLGISQHPFLVPAVEKFRPEFEKRFAELFK